MFGAATPEVGRIELAAMILFGIGCIAAILALPALAWVQLLPVAPNWMRTALLSGAIIPVGAGLVLAIVLRSRYRRRH